MMIFNLNCAEQTRPSTSPGLDGLTSEFSLVFADILSRILLDVFVCMEEKQCVPESLAT